ncbi:MAG: copper chaperone PCu(A)C [Shinella sp.]|nr:copper chaperone PCu(A)C [Shinella sp.]
MRHLFAFCSAVLFLLGSAPGVFAHEYRLGDIEIRHPASRAMLPGQPVGGGFMTIVNHGSTPDRLVAITSPVSGDVQLHEMAMENDVMKMRQLPDGIEIPAGGTVELKRGGLHVMFMGIKEPFKEGEKVKATLVFEKAGRIDVDFNVEPANAKAGAGKGEDEGHAGHDM